MATPKINASVQLCSLDDLREWISKTGGATEEPDDTFLGRLIDRFSMWFETATNRTFKFEESTKLYQGNGRPLLYSSVAPIAQASQQISTPVIESWDGSAWSDVTSSLDLDLTDPDQIGAMVLRAGIWSAPPAPYANWRITLTAGYGATSEAVPDDVRNAAMIGCDLLLRYRNMGMHIISSQSNVDGVSWSTRDLAKKDREGVAFLTDVVGNYRLGW
jgi:hypothetical protein